MSEVDRTLRDKLSKGIVESRTLSELLTLDFGTLLRTVEPTAPNDVVAQLSALNREGKHELGVIQRMQLAGNTLHSLRGIRCLPKLIAHTSDTVRGWGAFVIACEPSLSLEQRYAHVKPLADDANAGTREWAWIALRPFVAADVDAAIKLGLAWSEHPSANIRRYGVEIVRPRGVWCAHISSLRKNPSPALPLLEALRHDETKYVQDSVANWMNDASKDSPAWVRSVVRSWQKEAAKRDNAKALQRICTRAMRTLEKNNAEDAAPKQSAKRAAKGKKMAPKSVRAKQGTATSRNGRAKNIRE